MGKKSMEARATKFVGAVARRLVQDDQWTVGVISRLEALLAEAAADLPSKELQSAITSDLARFAHLLRENVGKIRPDLLENEVKAVESVAQGKDDNKSQELILTDEGFAKSVETLLVSSENGTSKEEWIAVCRRLLGSRMDAPPGLWWTYAALELDCSPEPLGTAEERALHVITCGKSLMGRLMTLAVGRTASVTAIVALAPVVTLLFEAGCILNSAASKTDSRPSKSWRKALKSLKSVCVEVLGSLALIVGREQGSSQEAEDRKYLNELSVDFRGLILAGKAINKLTGLGKSERKGIAILFPLSSKAMKKFLIVEVHDMRTCAGVVGAEVVLMRLMVGILERRSDFKGQVNLENHDFLEEFRLSAVHGAALFEDALIDLLLDSELPVKPFLSTREESFLRGILYDVLLIDSAKFQHQQKRSETETGLIYLKKVALARGAIQFFRTQGARTKAVELSSRLTTWGLPTGFSAWLKSLKVKQKVLENLSDASTVDDNVISSILAKCASRKGQKIGHSEEKLPDDAFFVDKTGDLNLRSEDAESEAADKAFVNAAKSMRDSRTQGASEKANGNDIQPEDDIQPSHYEQASSEEEEEGEEDEGHVNADKADYRAIDNIGAEVEAVLLNEKAGTENEATPILLNSITTATVATSLEFGNTATNAGEGARSEYVVSADAVTPTEGMIVESVSKQVETQTSASEKVQVEVTRELSADLPEAADGNKIEEKLIPATSQVEVTRELFADPPESANGNEIEEKLIPVTSSAEIRVEVTRELFSAPAEAADGNKIEGNLIPGTSAAEVQVDNVAASDVQAESLIVTSDRPEVILAETEPAAETQTFSGIADKSEAEPSEMDMNDQKRVEIERKEDVTDAMAVKEEQTVIPEKTPENNVEPETPKRTGRRKREPEIKLDTPSSVRCTRSGRKYGDSDAVTTSRKRQKPARTSTG